MPKATLCSRYNMADGARPQREPMRRSADTASRTNVEMEKVDRGPMTFMYLEVSHS